MAELNVNIGSLQMKNPVMTASGTFGYGIEYADFFDISRLGGIIVKGTTVQLCEGNPYPRMAETPSGMLNAVGLQNKGAQYFIDHIYPQIMNIGTNMLVNVSGSSIENYVECAEKIAELDKIPAIELNIPCPIAKAVEAEGADAVSMINTMMGMAVDAEKRKPVLSTVTGGLSGPCIKPVALRMVWQTSKAVNIPIIGLGGISCWKDAVEFMLAGATAIQIGTYNFIDPTISVKVIEGINDYCDRHGFKSVKEIIGAMEV